MKQLLTLFLLPSLVFAIPWPLAPADSTHKIDGSYGGSNIPWDSVSSSNPSGNFHSGIDLFLTELTLPGQEEVVYSVEAGVVTDVLDGAPPSAEQWFVVCDSLTSEEGWAYLHVTNPFGKGYEDIVGFYDSLACVHQDTSSYSHLHFMRSGREYNITYGPAGRMNPLSVLDPAPTGSSYIWQFDPQPDSTQHPWCYFLADKTIEDWEADWTDSLDIFEDTLSADDLHGSVDLIQGFSLWGYGDCVTQPGIDEFWLEPYRIRWDLVLEGSIPSSDKVLVENYLVSFDGLVGSFDDWEKYRQFFFRFTNLDTYFPGKYGDIICLTNCGDAQGWSGLGISNIEEGCWNTALALGGSGENYNPILQDPSASDGFYRIDVTAYAWDTTDSQRVSIDCQVCNTREVAQEVVLTDAATRSEVWRAEWVAEETSNGFEPVKDVQTNEPATPGSTLDIEIVFTGPMDTTVVPYVRFGKPGGTELVAEADSVAWTSTYLPSGYYDTWHGTVEVPSSGMSGWLTMKIKAKDNTGLGLLDPSDANPPPPATDRYEDYTDLHHGFGISFGPEAGWDGELEHQVESSPVLADMDGDGDLDVGIVDCDGWVHLLDDDGTSLNSNWPEPGWSYFPQPIRVAPVIVDLDGDGGLDVISTHNCGGIARDIETGANLPGWPVYLGIGGPDSLLGQSPSCASPVVGDADGDGSLEVVICRVFTNTSVNLESTVFMFDHTGGTRKWACNLEPSLDGASVYATPAMCDVDGGDGIEVLVATAEGYQIQLNGADSTDLWNQSGVYLLNGATGEIIWEESFSNCQIYGAPVVADLEGDGTNEVIFGIANTSQNWKVHILDGVTGNVEHSLDIPNRVYGPVGVGDLDDDGYLDIVVGVQTNGIYAWSGAGSHALLPGFPVGTTGSVKSGITLVDMDADFELEIVVGTGDGLLYAINADGSICTGFPVDTGDGISGQVAAGDIDGDGALELVGADDGSAQAWCYDMGSGTYPCEMPWRQFQHDSWHSGCYEADNTVPAAPTGLAASVTYTMFGYTADLTWELSVNDAYSPDPEDPADVTDYRVYRAFPPGGYSLVGHTYAGDGTYTDMCSSPLGQIAKYAVTASDGTNESEYCDYVKFKTSPGMNLAEGCRVEEELERGVVVVTEVEIPERMEAAPVGLPTEIAVGPVNEASALVMASDPGLLTDGEMDEEYVPGAGVRAVVLDLGIPCRVDHVEVAGTGEDGTAAIDAGASCSIEYSVDGEEWHPALVRGADASGSVVRYVRFAPAPVATEVEVWGVRTEEDQTEAEIGLERSEAGWTLAVPELGVTSRGEAGTLSVYDLAGRLVRSWEVQPGDAVEWDGATGSGVEAAPGCYFVRYEQCGRAVTRRLVVIEEQ